MRDVIGIREVLKEVYSHVLNSNNTLVYRTHSCAFTEVEPGKGGIPQTKVYEDNKACLKHARMPKMSPRTKHIAIPYHFFRSKVEELEIAVEPNRHRQPTW